MTPEECSSEVLRTLFGYLPEQIRNGETVATVITVPAAFNQMQKDATIEAARAAGLGKVALMQEPVAAVMSVMRSRQGDGIFLIYDLGGGTLDIAIAQSIGGRVSLLGQGGIQMCGGRDFDRMIVDNLVMPWLQQTFALPEGFSSLPEYKLLRRVAERAVEKAKIELSSRDNAVIRAQETECGCKDLAGIEIYLDVNITRDQLGELIEGKVKESVQAARDTIEHAGLTPHDIERIVFVGGPTQYKPLRERVAFELGIAPSTDVNPMTAVATGAAIFAEAIDWSAHSRGRKSSRGSVSVGSTLDLTVNYAARTPDQKAKIALKLGSPAAPGSSFQVDSLDTGWSSGRAEIKNGTVIEVPLSKRGENTFKMFVFDPAGGPLSLAQDRIVITQTAATIDAIPASHSIGVEVLDTVGDMARLHYLVKAGDQLPARGVQPFKAAEALRAGAPGSLKFKLWEGDIDHPVSDNTFIGLFEITGNDFVDGVIPAGAPLILTYEIGDGGNIDLKVEIPAIGGSFQSDKNFYSRASGMIDYSSAARRILDDALQAAEQLAEVSAKVDDPALSEARERLELAASISEQESDPEVAKQASDNVQRAKSLLASARKANFRHSSHGVGSGRCVLPRHEGLGKAGGGQLLRGLAGSHGASDRYARPGVRGQSPGAAPQDRHDPAPPGLVHRGPLQGLCLRAPSLHRSEDVRASRCRGGARNRGRRHRRTTGGCSRPRWHPDRFRGGRRSDRDDQYRDRLICPRILGFRSVSKSRAA